MFAQPRSLRTQRMAVHVFGAALVCVGAMACKGGGSSPTSPSNPGGGPSGAASCRTGATSSHSVQTLADGSTVTSDTKCSVSGSTVTCDSSFVDSRFGSGTMTQTSRYETRNDLIDEVATNPPLSRSQGTTTVTTVSGVAFTTTATNAYDAQRRLTSTAVVTQPSPLTATTTFSAWDSSGRPTAGTLTLNPGGQFAVSNTYDNANRTVRRDTGLNVCTQTHDANGIIVGESCTGTGASTTVVTINATQQICK